MGNFKDKIISGVLTTAMLFSMFLGVVPPVYAADNNLSNVKIYAEKTQSQIKSTGLTRVSNGVQSDWAIELWHYSGGYWGNNSVRIKDSDWKKTSGGVADLHTALTLEKQDFTYNVAKGSDLEKAIAEGKNVYVNIGSGDSSIKLSSLYEIETRYNTITETEEMITNQDGSLLTTDATAKVVKENGQYVIKVSMKPKLNYYTEDELSYKQNYRIALNKWVPFVANGFGYQVYSIFGGGFNAGYAVGWVNQKDPYSLEGMPAGRIHPSFITSPDGHMKAGHTLTVAGKSVDSGKVRIGDYTFRNAGAVGMRFIFPVSLDIYVEGGGAQVVASYLKRVGFNADGSPILQQIKTETTDAELDEKGAVKVENVKEIPEGTAYLNDVLTSPKNLSEQVQSLDWTKDLPKTTQEQINANAEDIWSYNLSIRTGLLKHIEDLTEMKNSNEYTQLKDLKDEFTRLLSEYNATTDMQEKSTLMFKINSIFAQLIQLSGYENPLNKTNASTLKTTKTAGITNVASSEEIIKKAIYLDDLDAIYLYPLDERPTEFIGEDAFEIENRKSADLIDSFEVQNHKASVGDNVTIEGTADKTTLYLRYIVIPERKIKTFVDVYKNGVYATTEVTIESLPVAESNDSKVEIPIVEGAELIKWGSSKELPLLEQMPTNPLKQGTTLEPISLDDDENLYVNWRKDLTVSTPVTDEKLRVEQWRLSKYTANLGWLSQAYMGLNLKTDAGHATSTLSPAGSYSYKTINPNNQYTDKNYNPANDNYNNYLHSKALTQGSYNVTHNNPSATVDVTGSLNLIKGTNTFGLKAASWITDSGTKMGLNLHNIETANLPSTYDGQATVQKSDLLSYGIENIQTFNHNYGVYYHYTCHHKDYSHDVCACYTLPESRSPKDSRITYLTADYKIDSTFDRYIAKSSDKLVAAPNVTTENGKTTIAYQINDTLKVYPEIAMLFDNDKGDSSIKWVIGEQAREINPVIYHTMQFKLFVDENSIISNYATDSRATTAARKLGEANKQVAYKGSPVNTTFSVKRSEDSTDKGILTVKTYALDLNTNKNGVNVKTAWGADSYNPLAIHNKFVSAWSGFKGTSTERLEIQSASLYTGANKTQSVSLNTKTYGGQSVTTFTHELIVRGGVVIGVRVQDKENNSYSVVSVEALKTKDANLYEALVGMKLVGSKQDTVLKGFEHQTGAQLTEDKFITLANQAKQNVDGLASNNLGIGKGWYSEDTTVLVVKEYITNYEVPSIAYSDKISLSVKGLESPINKNDFFSVLGKGHTYINYTFNSLDLSSINSGLKGSQKVFFEHSSRTGTLFGKINTDYLVGNVSVTDTTRIN
ncbi:hypothetical protein [Sinanaerobacter sp. ZZT-01]|uniref:hypothetical protein n=1 Tax=Sinanaerobacter sp. ZZT-01 TaxID=3111540 RepID=UPI002D77E6B9|nr:hypothetical protein [Sinanaerobacter sp. ZZT-01]WRR92724.1 hypothetical protein U5921_11805 [Sinanaerobacter sp. ZZT-01]